MKRYLKIEAHPKTGLHTVSGLTLTQMEMIISGLKIQARYLAAREETMSENHTMEKAICAQTLEELRTAVNEFKNVL